MMFNKKINFKLSNSLRMSNRQKYKNNIRKYIITTSQNNGLNSYQNNDFNNNTIGNTISEYYYKNPFFYNDYNLNLQLQILKDLQRMKFNRNQTPIHSNTNNTNLTTNHSSAISQNKFKTNKKEKKNIFPNNNKTEYKEKPKPCKLKFPNIKKIQTDKDNKIKIEINESTNMNEDENNKEEKIIVNNYNSIDSMSNTEKINNYTSFMNTPRKLKENDEYFYKIVFKSKPLFNSTNKLVVDNKYNMIYAENEIQYRKIIEKEYKRLISEGKKVKSKNVAPSIKLKLTEAKNRIQFMKGILDYSYPGFVLSKIKIMQKKLKDQKKNAKYLHCLNGMEKRNKENEERNEFRKEYLLKSITLLK